MWYAFRPKRKACSEFKFAALGGNFPQWILGIVGGRHYISSPTNNRTPHKITHTTSSSNCPTMISSAFARSRPLMARYDVSPHMTKWWKAVRPDDGQVRPLFHQIIVRFRWYGNQGIVNPTLALHKVGLGNTSVRRGWK